MMNGGRENNDFPSFPQSGSQNPIFTGEDIFNKQMEQHNPKKYYRAETSPAYASLSNLLNTAFRKEDFEDIFCEKDLSPKSSRRENFWKRWKWGVYWTPGCGFLIYRFFNKEVIVPPGHVCCFIDEENNYLFAKPGVHNIQNPFIKQVSYPISLNGLENQRTVIEHGDRCILTIPQGMLGYAIDLGEPVLLPPGLHSWNSETLRFERMYKMDDNPVLNIGPFTLVTVDEGYVAMTSNNGKLEILEAGTTHLLTHQKWKFERFINVKIQHDDSEKILSATADNVLIRVHATVIWRIQDVAKVAIKFSEVKDSGLTMVYSEDEYGSSCNVRNDVLNHIDAALSAFVGRINYAEFFQNSFLKAVAKNNGMDGNGNVNNDDSLGDFHLLNYYRDNEKRENKETDDNALRTYSTASTVDESNTTSVAKAHKTTENPFFDSQGIANATAKANETTNTFGIEILNISIISAEPADNNLVAALAAGAVASAESLEADTQAKGLANTMKIEAEAAMVTRKINADSEAKVTLIQAKADAEAEILRSDGTRQAEIQRAEGLKEAAKLLESSKVAVALETLKTSATAIKHSDKFFFGQEPSFMPNLVMNGGGGFIPEPDEKQILLEGDDR